MKTSHWPKPYIAEIPIWDKKKGKVVFGSIELWLPHEIIAAICDFTDVENFLSKDNIDAEAAARLAKCARELGVPLDELLGIGFWLDGCPCNWDRSQSLETVSMNFPYLGGEDNNFRIPLCGIEKGFVAKGKTFDAILEVLTWSLAMLAAKEWPSCRHDGTVWKPTDCWRSRKKGSLPIRAVLSEVRGDWQMFKHVFRFPQHNELAGICFKCTAVPADVRRPGTNADWRKPERRLTIWSLVQRMLDRGLKPSPLLSAPCVSVETFLIDWLHAVDLGVLCDFLGNLFFYVVEHKLHQPNRKARVAALFSLILDYYKRHPEIENKFDNLTCEMLRPDDSSTKPPKLRAKAAEARGLVGFAVELADNLLSDHVAHEHTMKMAAGCMARCYSSLSETSIFATDLLRENCRRFCTLYVALSDAFEDPLFRVKPKMHFFQELCEMCGPTRPALHWTYRDEDFGGFVAKTARRRGGKHSVRAQSRMILNRYAAKHRVPRFGERRIHSVQCRLGKCSLACVYM